MTGTVEEFERQRIAYIYAGRGPKSWVTKRAAEMALENGTEITFMSVPERTTGTAPGVVKVWVDEFTPIGETLYAGLDLAVPEVKPIRLKLTDPAKATNPNRHQRRAAKHRRA